MSTCKACLKDKKLIKAHIAPEWTYRALYPNGKVEGLSLIKVSSDSTLLGKTRIGIYDDQIFCADCDNHIGFFDEIGKDALIKEPSLYKDLGNTGKVYIIKDIDPTHLKIFFLSLILRASLSERKEYKNINLPDKFTDRLKEIIEGKLQTSLDEFAVLMTRFRSNQLKDVYKRYSQVPYLQRIEGVNFLILNLPNGYKIFVKVDQRLINDELRPFIIRADYPIYIIEQEYFEKSNEFKWLKARLSWV